jgi:polygalacturonase
MSIYALVRCRAGSPDPAAPIRAHHTSAGSGDPALHRILKSARTAFAALTLIVVARSTFATAATFNVREHGAAGDGHTLDTKAINGAIDACTHAGGGTVYLPPGQYLTGTIILKSHVTLQVDAGATILGSQDPADYPAFKSVWGDDTVMLALIYAEDAENITLSGRGTIDGQGAVWWKRIRLADAKRFPPGAQTAAEKPRRRRLRVAART